MKTSKGTSSKKTAIKPHKENSTQKNTDAIEEKHKFLLSEKEAKAASPEDIAVCGEEDPGEALEFLITDDLLKK